MIKTGDKVRYIGKDCGTYRKGKTYEVTGYDEELDMYGVMSELGEDYCVYPEDLEEIKGGRGN